METVPINNHNPNGNIKRRAENSDSNSKNKLSRITQLHTPSLSDDKPNLLALLDGLPYVDPSYGVENAPEESQVLLLIQNEMKKMPFHSEYYLSEIGDPINLHFEVKSVPLYKIIYKFRIVFF